MNVRALLKPLALPLALVLISVFFATQESSFLSSRSLVQLIIEFARLATLSLGVFMIILTGNIDLSIGSGAALLSGLAAVLISERGWSAAPALGVAVLLGILIWILMGALIVKQKVPSFIITLGGLLIFRGLQLREINNSTVNIARGGEENLYTSINNYFLPGKIGLVIVAVTAVWLVISLWRSRAERLANGLPLENLGRAILRHAAIVGAILTVVAICNGWRGVPLSLLILATVTIGVYFITQHMPFGRYLYAIGGNEEAARVSGIPVDRVIIGAFALMGLATAFTGFMVAADVAASTTTAGELMELDAIAACVIGGTALKGGRGTVWGVLLGALLMTVLLNGMGLMGVEDWLKRVVRGVVLVLAVWLDVRFSRA